jgi:flagellar hook-length control protein FliK
MQTTAISSPANQVKAPSANTQSASKSDNTSTSFSDMLSSEMDRSSADKANNTPAPVATAPTPAKSQSTQNTQNQNNAQAATQANSSSATQQSSNKDVKDANSGNAQKSQATDGASQAAAQSTTTAQAGKNTTADGDQQDDASGLTPESSDLIALVTNMNQQRTTVADGKTGKDADADAKGKDKDATDISAVADTQVPADAAALAAQAQAAQAAQATQTAQTVQPSDTTTDTSGAATTQTDVLAGTNRKIPAPSTPIERGIMLNATRAGSELKDTAASSDKGKNTAIGATSFDAKLGRVQASDKVSAEPLATDKQTTQSMQDAHAEATAATPHSDATAASTTAASAATAAAHEVKTPQQDQAAMANIAAMSNASATTLSQVQAAAAQIVDNLAPRVGTQQWNQSLGQKVVWMANGEVQNASLTLNPPDLGPLQVVLSVTNNHATAEFTAAQPEVRQALESAMPKLREMLGDAGIQLGQANVSAGTPNQQNSFGSSSQQSSRHGSGKAEELGDAPVRVARVLPAQSGNGLVDTFV